VGNEVGAIVTFASSVALLVGAIVGLSEVVGTADSVGICEVVGLSVVDVGALDSDGTELMDGGMVGSIDVSLFVLLFMMVGLIDSDGTMDGAIEDGGSKIFSPSVGMEVIIKEGNRVILPSLVSVTVGVGAIDSVGATDWVGDNVMEVGASVADATTAMGASDLISSVNIS